MTVNLQSMFPAPSQVMDALRELERLQGAYGLQTDTGV